MMMETTQVLLFASKSGVLDIGNLQVHLFINTQYLMWIFLLELNSPLGLGGTDSQHALHSTSP